MTKLTAAEEEDSNSSSIDLGEVERGILQALSSSTSSQNYNYKVMTSTVLDPSSHSHHPTQFSPFAHRDENDSHDHALRTKCRELEDAYSALRARCSALETKAAAAPAYSVEDNSYEQHAPFHHLYPNEHNACTLRAYPSTTSRCTRSGTSSARPATSYGGNTSASRRLAKENQDLISSLYERNDMLMRDYSALRSKHQNVLTNNGKLKKEVQTLRLRTSGKRGRPGTSIFPTSASFAAATKIRTSSKQMKKNASSCYKSVHDDTSHSHSMLGDTCRMSMSTHALAANTQSLVNRIDEAERRVIDEQPTQHESEREQLVKELASTTTKLHSIQQKYRELESMCNECLDKLEETKDQLRTARQENGRLGDTVSELRMENISLEEKMTRICCGSPLANKDSIVASSTNTTSSPIVEIERLSEKSDSLKQTCDPPANDPATEGSIASSSPSSECNNSRAELDVDEYADDFE